MTALATSHAQHRSDTEAFMLGGLLVQPDRIDAVADILTADDFQEQFFGHIFGLIVTEHGRGNSLNPLTLRRHIADLPQYAAIGGDKLIANWGTTNTLVAPPVALAKSIANEAKRRRLADGLTEGLALIRNPDTDIAEAIDVADAAISAVGQSSQAIDDIDADAALARLADDFNRPLRGVTCTIIPTLDDLVGPMRPKEFYVLAGRPGMGKSAVASSYALGVAQSGAGVLFVSLEMSTPQLVSRMAADLSFDGRTGVPLNCITQRTDPRAAVRAIDNARRMLSDIPLRIVDTGSLTLGRLDMMIRRHKRRMAAKGVELGLVVIDYLQLLRTDTRSTSRYEIITEISSRVRGMAKDHDVAILALAQLSREVEKRPSKEPQLSDLRESGQIEQDADAVIFLLRQEYYLRQSEPEKDTSDHMDWQGLLAEHLNKIEFIVAKHRHRCAGRGTGEFHAIYQAVRG